MLLLLVSGVAWAADQNVVSGTDGPDTLEGTKGRDNIVGLSGDDEVYGLGGYDYGTYEDPGGLLGNKGNDLIRGGTGRDPLEAGHGSDSLYGGPGPDQLYEDDLRTGDSVRKRAARPPLRRRGRRLHRLLR